MATTSVKTAVILGDRQDTARTVADQLPMRRRVEITILGDRADDEDCTVEWLRD